MIAYSKNLSSKSEANVMIFTFITYFYITKFIILYIAHNISYTICCSTRGLLTQEDFIYISSLYIAFFFLFFSFLNFI